MIDFLNACVFCFVVGSVAKLITGQEDAGLLTFFALLAIVARVIVWLANRPTRGRVRRDGRTPKRRS